MDRFKLEEESDIELRSEDYHYILGKTPNWILRWGITFTLLFIVLLLIGSFFFKYPDTISSPFVLTGTTPPIRVKAKNSGLLSELFVSDNQKVIEGEYLAVIENPAQTNDVIYIKRFIKGFLEADSIGSVLPTKHLQLGDLQTTYLVFYQSLYDYIEFKQNNYHKKKIDVLKERKKRNLNKYNDLLNQQLVVSKQYSIKEKQFLRDSILNTKGIISQEEFERTNIGHLDTYLGLLSINSSTKNIQISVTEINESLIDIENDYIEKNNHFKMQIRNYAVRLLTEIESWEFNFVLKSPLDGEISFSNYWSINQNITVAEDVFNIIPLRNGLPIAKAFIPLARSGKVKKGQRVNLHLDNFPDNEYGVLRGIVSNISLLPSVSDNVNYYVVEIELPDGLITGYKKHLPYFPEMKGTAEIITEDLSLLQRILFPIRKILTERLR